MRLPAVVGLTATVALIAASAADARTLRLNWVEKTSPTYGYPAMTFRVRSVTVNRSSWSVRASLVNRSQHNLWLKPHLEPVAPTIGTGSARFGLLKPKSGNGTFAGTGTLPRGKLINVSFGAFYSVEVKRNFSWTTAHAFKL